MSNAIIDVSSYWNARGHIDVEQAFIQPSSAIDYIRDDVKDLPPKYSAFKGEVRRICQFIQDGHFEKVGSKVKIQDQKCEIVAALPDGTYLVLAETLSARRDRVHIRLGAKCQPHALKKTKTNKDITDYWRKDNTIRRDRSFITVKDAIAYIRREASNLREGSAAAPSAIFLATENTCLAIEHDFFRLIGNTVRTNERGPDATRGPLPTSGKLVAVLPEGKGLAMSNKVSNGTRYGFLVGRKRMAQIIRDTKKRK